MMHYDEVEGPYCSVHGGDNIVVVQAYWRTGRGSPRVHVCLVCVAEQVEPKTWNHVLEIAKAQ